MRQRWILLMLAGAASACGSDDARKSADDGTLDSCGLEAQLSRGSTLQFVGDDSACATQHSFDSGLEVLFVGTSSVDGSLELQIHDVLEGETGADFDTRVIVVDAAGERFQGNACLTTITEHRLLETEASPIGELRHYQVSGEGRCPDPLTPANAATFAASLDAFAFRAQFTWRD